MKNIILISKDAQPTTYFPIYGNNLWKTPNIDELAAKGTVFYRHYTAAVSTAMAFTSIALGKNCFETDRKRYEQVDICSDETIFDKFFNKGYEVHIAWDKSYDKFSKKYFGCEGKNTIVHNIDSIIPNHSPHIAGEFDDLSFSQTKEQQVYSKIEELFSKISVNQQNLFLWLHLPHVLDGRNSYGSDIDMFDNIIGLARKYFKDDEIAVSADHGNMDGHKDKFGYGFDTHEKVIRVPLITPLINSTNVVNTPTTHLDLFDILFNKQIKKRDFIYADTAYYLQPNRKLSVLKDNYKLTYDKLSNKYTLYDVVFDPDEKFDLFSPEYYDIDRRRWYSLNQRFYYPHWEDAHRYRSLLLKQISKVYRKGKFLDEIKEKIVYKLKIIYILLFIKNKSKKKIINIGK